VRAPPRTPRILVVDDHGDGQSDVAALLEGHGCEVTVAENGERALERMIHEREPSLVVLDLAMPVTSGMELLYVMQRNRRLSEIPVVVLTEHELLPTPLGTMFMTRLGKPYDAESLLTVVERCIHQSRD